MIHEKIEIQLKDSEFKANLFTYFLDNSPEIDPERKRPVVLICPGGGYQMTSDREAEALAVRFMAMGYHAAILRYSVAPARFPEALLQLATAVAMLRENAEKWHILLLVDIWRQALVYSGTSPLLQKLWAWTPKSFAPMGLCSAIR